eukprot:8223993-Alexandrium_andersonii.AAC.1
MCIRDRFPDRCVAGPIRQSAGFYIKGCDSPGIPRTVPGQLRGPRGSARGPARFRDGAREVLRGGPRGAR